MENPWLDLPAVPSYVLPTDSAIIHSLMGKLQGEHELHLNLLPEPFLGRPDAPVVLLGLNPGYCVEDEPHHKSEPFVALSRANLVHAPAEYPFYLLHPEIAAPGKAWWDQRLGYLLREVDRKAVADSVLCVEYFPYHSAKYGVRSLLPSQEYGFYLVRTAVQRGALVIALRSRRLWLQAVPELAAYPGFHQLRNPQNPTFTRNNCPDAFDEVVRVIRAAAARAD